uniref:Uncharacterized protein n=1 Tax=Heterorhabditis bacteriophora TaxID=37862 RepID=A0A1I7XPD3_HETBA
MKLHSKLNLRLESEDETTSPLIHKT